MKSTALTTFKLMLLSGSVLINWCLATRPSATHTETAFGAAGMLWGLYLLIREIECWSCTRVKCKSELPAQPKEKAMSHIKYGVAKSDLSKTATQIAPEETKVKPGQAICPKCAKPRTDSHSCSKKK